MRLQAGVLELMPALVTSLIWAVLVVTIPFTLVLKVLLRLPRPLALAHRRWALPVNFGLIASITWIVVIFIRNVYYAEERTSAELASQFLIVALAYAFGLVLMLRQFGGVYPDYIVTTGFTGFGLRKTAYRAIVRIEKTGEAAGETRFRIETVQGRLVRFSLPTRYVSIFNDQMAKMRNERSL